MFESLFGGKKEHGDGDLDAIRDKVRKRAEKVAKETEEAEAEVDMIRARLREIRSKTDATAEEANNLFNQILGGDKEETGNSGL